MQASYDDAFGRFVGSHVELRRRQKVSREARSIIHPYKVARGLDEQVKLATATLTAM